MQYYQKIKIVLCMDCNVSNKRFIKSMEYIILYYKAKKNAILSYINNHHMI